MPIKIVGDMPPEDFPEVAKRLVEDMVEGLRNLADDLKLDRLDAAQHIGIAMTAHSVVIMRNMGMGRTEFSKGMLDVWDQTTLRLADTPKRPN